MATDWLEFDAGDLVSLEGGREVWRLNVSALALIAEYTTATGPADDWFLIFGYLEGGQPRFYQCAVPANVEPVLASLGEKFGSHLGLTLVASTTFASRVVWGAAPVGSEFFEVVPPTGYLTSLWHRVSGHGTDMRIRADVLVAMQAAADSTIR